MFFLTEPNDETIRNFLGAQRRDDFSYASVGASRTGGEMKGYNVDRNRVRIGRGGEDFEKAIQALKSWKMFEINWVRLCWTNTPIVVGETVAVLAYHFGFWSLNASRIVYVLEETGGAIERYGFAYGTLTEHGECGEERFTVEFHRADETVWYDLYAFSNPQHVLAQIGYPLGRMLQKEFAQESKKAMTRAVGGGRVF